MPETDDAQGVEILGRGEIILARLGKDGEVVSAEWVRERRRGTGAHFGFTDDSTFLTPSYRGQPLKVLGARRLDVEASTFRQLKSQCPVAFGEADGVWLLRLSNQRAATSIGSASFTFGLRFDLNAMTVKEEQSNIRVESGWSPPTEEAGPRRTFAEHLLDKLRALIAAPPEERARIADWARNELQTLGPLSQHPRDEVNAVKLLASAEERTKHGSYKQSDGKIGHMISKLERRVAEGTCRGTKK